MAPTNASICTIEQLQQVCEAVGDMSQHAAVVKEISVTGCGMKLAHMPPAMFQLTGIVKLNLSGNAITQLPFNLVNFTNLQVLNVSRNQLTSLPPEIGHLPALIDLDASRNQLGTVQPGICELTQLQFLNLMGNQITELPENFGQLSKLRRLGLKSNRLQQLPSTFTQLTDLVELFITDNQLESFPDGISNMRSLVKLQASFNSFRALPADLFHLPRLELCRVAVCNISQLPPNLLSQKAHRLAWFSLSGNPVCPAPPTRGESLPNVQMADLEMGRKLGDGASGEVFAATHQGEEVAVKLFHADVSPDGRTEEEVALACFVQHEGMVRVRGMLQQPQGMVMDLVQAQPMADKPVFEPLLRCRWKQGTTFTLQQVLAVARGVSGALQYLHKNGICHGDVYAHNILVDSEWNSTICDFGAAFCYPAEQKFWEIMEVRAFGLFLNDLVQRLEPGTDAAAAKVIQQLASDCVESEAATRPDFAQVSQALQVAGC